VTFASLSASALVLFIPWALMKKNPIIDVRMLFSRQWCRPECGWNSVWRVLRQHEGIVSGGKVNRLIDGLCGERLPTIHLAHVDLS